MQIKSKTGIFLYLPITGIFLFFVLYILAASKYPGGSQAYDYSIGFDWVHNYWCDLMKEVAYNKIVNPARPIAIAATFLLAFSVALFSIYFPKYLPVSSFWNTATRISGILAMAAATFIFTDLHDLVIVICSLFGLVTIAGVFKGLIHNKEKVHQRIAVFCFFLILMNNVFYYIEYYYYLPFFQKITFAIILLWLMSINWLFVQKNGRTPSKHPTIS